MHHVFENRVEDVKPLKSDINALILDYLTTEGYPSAAEKFSSEAKIGIHPEDIHSIGARREIQQAIHSGRIEHAIEALNELNPQILDGDSTLHFSLLRLQLVELIRTYNAAPGNDIAPALEFATTHLAPRAPTNPQFLEDLECTMSLLFFPPDNLEPHLAALLHPDLRRNVADNVNKAILTSQHQRRDATIRNLVRLRAWAENTARENKMPLPAHMDLGLDPDNSTSSHSIDNNGDDAMITS